MDALKRLLAPAPETDGADGAGGVRFPRLPPPLQGAADGVRGLLAGPGPGGPAWSVRLGRAELDASRVQWSDAAAPGGGGGALLGLDPIDASIGRLDTASPEASYVEATLRVQAARGGSRPPTPDKDLRPGDPGDPGAPLRAASLRVRTDIAAEWPGETPADLGRGIVRAAGELHPHAGFASGVVIARGLDLTNLNPYLPAMFPGLQIVSSSLDLRLSPRVSASGSGSPWPIGLQDALLRAGGEVVTRYTPPEAESSPETRADPAPPLPFESIVLEYGPLNTERPVAGRFIAGARVAGGVVGVGGTLVPRPRRPAHSELEAFAGAEGLDLRLLSPLLAPTLGRTLAGGTLTAAAPVTVSGGHLRASVPIAVEGLRLGDRVDAPAGGKAPLPTGLLVAMLRAPDGSLALPPIPLDVDLTRDPLDARASVAGAASNLLFSVAANPLRAADGLTRRGVDGVFRAAAGVTGLAGGVGLGAGGLALDTLRGLGGLLGLGGGGDADAPPPGSLLLPVENPRWDNPAGELTLQAVAFEPGTADLRPGAPAVLDRLSGFARGRGLGLRLTPLVDPLLDGPALVALRTTPPPDGVATARMLRNLALRRARLARLWLTRGGVGGPPWPPGAVRLDPPPAVSADNPSAAWRFGPPGVRFELFDPGSPGSPGSR